MLEAAAAAVATAGDAVARVQGIGAVPDVGLYGGTVVPARAGTRLTLAGDQLVPGVAVSGTVDVGPATVTAVLTVAGTGLPPTSLSASWPAGSGVATATVTGISGGVAVAGTCPAP